MRTVQILVLSFIAAVGLSCTGRPGERELTTFGNAVQAGDEATAAQVSLVEFPGKVSTWEIVTIGPESSEPFPLVKLLEERTAMVKELEAMFDANDTFIQDNVELYDKYKPRTANDPDTKFTGELKEFAEELGARLEKQTALDQKIRDAGKTIDAVKKAASLSTNTPGLGSKYEGDVLEKVANVRFDNKDYTVTLKQYALINTEHNIRPMARWIITDIQE